MKISLNAEPKEIIRNKITKLIKDKRLLLGKKQYILAKHIGIDRKAYSNIERGISLPTALTFIKLCIVLELTREDFINIFIDN